MSTTEHQGLGISLVPVLVGFIAGAPAGALMKAAVDKGVAAGNEELVASTWMSTSLGTPTLQVAMRSEAHAALGNCFLRGERDEVCKLVLHLAGGNPDQLQSALFIIRQTETTHGKADVVVSELFRQSLNRLSSRRADFPKRTREKWLMPLLRANGAL